MESGILSRASLDRAMDNMIVIKNMKKFLMSVMVVFEIIIGTRHSLAVEPIFIETVPVKDTNNVADPLTGYGAVQNEFRIARTEVTVLQYCAFLNAVAKHDDPYHLYNRKMSSDVNTASIDQSYDSTNKCFLYTPKKGAENFPITHVSWSSAARFCNWLHNDQPESHEGQETTEQGAYDLNGFMGGVVPVTKKAIWFLPTEDQWYKAAYYKGGGTHAGYWRYPTQSDVAPDNSMMGDNSNNANVFIVKTTKNWRGASVAQETYSKNRAPFLTAVDTFTNACGPYYTYDMGGNVFEWVDAKRTGLNPDVQVIRGGAWSKDFGVASLESIYRNATNSFSSETSTIGFRVATQSQPLTLFWVTVGDPGNPPDPVTGHGAVNESFQIGKYPITAEQFALFLNSVASNSDPYGLYNPWMRNDVINGSIICTPFAGHFYYSVKARRKKFPINYVSWFDAARFCNWVHNGCPEGNEDESTTEDGAYSLQGRCNGMLVPLNENAQCYIPSEDQWYKAAYYDGEGDYHEYPAQSDNAPENKIGGGGNQANYNHATIGTSYTTSGHLTPVNLFSGTESYYGARDIGGNICEWNNTTMDHFGMTKVEARGGSFKTDVSFLAKEKNQFFFSGEDDCGYRVAAPEH